MIELFVIAILVCEAGVPIDEKGNAIPAVLSLGNYETDMANLGSIGTGPAKSTVPLV